MKQKLINLMLGLLDKHYAQVRTSLASGSLNYSAYSNFIEIREGIEVISKLNLSTLEGDDVQDIGAN